MPYSRKLGERAAGTALVAADGTADVVLNGPFRGYVEIDTVQITCTVSAPLPTCVAYEGTAASRGRELGFLRAGDQGTFRGAGDRLNAGQQITFHWAGATPGATCRAILRGSEYS